jgi:hypothetical protein
MDATLTVTLFYLPAEELLAVLRQHLPELARTLNLHGQHPSPPGMTILAAVAWVALAMTAWVSMRLLRFLRRMAEFGFSNLHHQCRLAGSVLRTWLTLRRQQVEGTSVRLRPAALGMATEFSSTDLSILGAVARLTAGFSTSAPELADLLGLRPVEIQKSLEKLYRNKLLDTTLGSTDGFDNYVISTSGAVLMAMMSRN